MDISEILSRGLGHRENLVKLIRSMKASIEALPPDTEPDAIEQINVVISVLDEQSKMVTDLMELCAILNDKLEKTTS